MAKAPAKGGGGLKRKVGPMPLWAWGVALGVGLGVILYLRARSKASGSTLPAAATGSAYTPLDNSAAGGGPPVSPNTGAAGIDPGVVSGWLADYVGGIAATNQAAFGLVSASQQSLVDALGYETALSGYAVTGSLQLAESTSSNAFSLASQAIAIVTPASAPPISNPAPSNTPSGTGAGNSASQPPSPVGHNTPAHVKPKAHKPVRFGRDPGVRPRVPPIGRVPV